MRRTDRLFELIQILRDGQLHTSAQMARRLAVSPRTIWRDMETLIASGVPVEGERGQGYRLTSQITLPPLTLSEIELEALNLGMAVVAEGADPELQGAARALSARIEEMLPGHRTAPAAGWGFAVFPFADAASGFPHMPVIRAAIRARTRLRLTYGAPDRDPVPRVVRPLQMEYWGRLWTLTAWCELREDFRMFRVDRIETLSDTGEPFQEEPGKTLADHMARFTEGPDGN
ncbi:helix-turn-helix transcriptional regulator [Frigidibacter sp. ROC022]|uniref:helix-turn-helix transcriptional regulator n=1 Tax=Frigidibacter sp. ROC022 TaxID=2971796 RepID=UPI00215A9486|nr:YafY family protein [Frigidibacter sp. ROC022]MCR8723353.1 YafY family transcriptional regulator [Frigidibacter sp. ROC022]